MRSGRKLVSGCLLNRRIGFRGILLLVTAVVLSVLFASTFFMYSGSTQRHVRDITVVIPPDAVDSVANSLRDAGFRQIHAISYDPQVAEHSDFTSFRKAHGAFGDDVSSMSNTTFILFAGAGAFKVPQNLPALPQRAMVIGYSFAECHEGGYALLMPTQLEYSMITRDAMHRYADFATSTLKKSMDASEAFRTFCDFHSLHLLIMPCGTASSSLPRWDALEVVEYENPNPPKPWDNIEKIEEVWKIKNVL